MSQITIKTDAVRSINVGVRQNHSKLSDISHGLSSLRHDIDHQIMARRNIRMRMANAYNSSNELELQIGKIETFINKSINSYCAADDMLANKASSKANNLTNVKAFSLWNSVLNYLGQAGQLGSFLSFALKPFANWADYGIFNLTTKVGAPAVVDILKAGTSTLKGLWKWQKSNEGLKKIARIMPDRANMAKIRRLVGFNDIMIGRASKAGKWGTRFYNNFHKLDNWITRAESNGIKGVLSDFTKGGAKAAFAWGGTILSGLANAFENADEAKSGIISTQRAVVETISETAIDIGKYALIGAGATAAVAATVGSAPVIIVGAATVGITMGLDYVSKKCTGKDLTELVSDSIIDVGEGAMKIGGNLIKQAYNNATNCFINPKANTVAKWFTQFVY